MSLKKGKFEKDKSRGIWYGRTMQTALDIESALEKLPESEQLKVSQWFEDHRLIVESSSALGAIYDEEDGGESQIVDE